MKQAVKINNVTITKDEFSNLEYILPTGMNGIDFELWKKTNKKAIESFKNSKSEYTESRKIKTIKRSYTTRMANSMFKKLIKSNPGCNIVVTADNGCTFTHRV